MTARPGTRLCRAAARSRATSTPRGLRRSPVAAPRARPGAAPPRAGRGGPGGGPPAAPAAPAAATPAPLFGLGLARPHVAGNSLGGGVARELARAGGSGWVAAIAPAGMWAQPL